MDNLDQIADALRAAFASFEEAANRVVSAANTAGFEEAANRIASAASTAGFEILQQEERPKYDPFNARAMWERPCPQKMYREKRPLRMVERNVVVRVNKPRNCRGRRDGNIH